MVSVSRAVACALGAAAIIAVVAMRTGHAVAQPAPASGAVYRPVLQESHAGKVWSAAFSPDGKFFASQAASSYPAIKIWDTRTWTLQTTIPLPDSSVQTLAFTADSLRLALDVKNEVRFWRVPDGAADSKLPAPAHDLYFSNDGQTALCTDYGGARLFDMPSGKLRRLISGATHALLNPSGRVMVAAADFQPARPHPNLGVWDPATGKLIRKLVHDTGHDVDSYIITPDGKTLISEQTVRPSDPAKRSLVCWDLESGARRWTRKTSIDHYFALMAMAPKGDEFAVSDGKVGIQLWSVKNGTYLRSLLGHVSPEDFLAYSPDGQYLASGGRSGGYKLIEGEVQIWGVRDGRVVRTLASRDRGTAPVAFSPDGRQFIATAGDGTMKLWDLREMRLIKSIPGESGSVQFLTGSRLIAGEAIWDTRSWKKIRSLAGAEGPSAVTSDGKYLASGFTEHVEDGTESYPIDHLKVWDLARGRIIRDIAGLDEPLIFSSDGRIAIAGGAGRERMEGSSKLRVWDVATGKALHSQTVSGGYVSALALSPRDGTTLAMAVRYQDTQIRFIDRRSGRRVRKSIDPPGSVESMAISPNGDILAAMVGSYRDPSAGERFGPAYLELQLYSMANGSLLKSVDVGDGFRGNVVFSPDGSTVAPGGGDRVTRFLDVRTGRLKATLAVLPVTELGSDVSSEWIAYTPEGHYAGTPRARDFLRWEAGGKLLPLDTRSGWRNEAEKVRSALWVGVRKP